MTEVHNKEVRGFETEIKQLLKLVVHSLYSNKEIFLRELISNASDALEKLRTSALTAPDLLEQDPDLKIQIRVDKDNKQIIISDNGIGMNRQDAIENLGTIAKSGTREFLQLLSENQLKDNKLIGQFGVGFYSAYIVADKVTVESRKAGEAPEEGVRWESAGEGEFSVETIDKAERGTTIILHLKEDETEFLEDYRLKGIVHKYSDHIEFPICMQKHSFAATENKEEPAAEVIEDEIVNRATALWTRPKNDIKHEDYVEFYKHISHDATEPLAYAHNRVEGTQEYTSLLYIPARAPFDLWQRESQQRGVKLYVKRVFIMDNAEQFLPSYLRFVKGVVDSNDLPLNISREILQNNRLVNAIKQGITKRVLGMLETMAQEKPEDYAKFWKEFGQVLKEGPAEDFQNREQIAKLLRFSSTFDDNDTPNISLPDYVARMSPSQNKIYYITAESFLASKNSPHLEIFRKKNIEVLLLHDRVDEWLTAHLHEFDGKSLQSVAKGHLDLGEEESAEEKQKQESLESENKSFLEAVKHVLGDKIKEVKLSQRLTNSPACLIADDNDMGSQLKRILEAAGQDISGFKPILELNPDHALVEKLKTSQPQQDKFTDLALFLYEQSVVAEGGHLDDPAAFVRRVNHFIVEGR